MASMEVDTAKRTSDVQDYIPCKRFKTSELPLNFSQRSTIDGLLHTIKKKGEYDALRKQVWAQYLESDDKTSFTSSLNDLAETEIDRDPSLLSRERGKAATLMQGAVDRSNIYKRVELSLDALIAGHLGHVESVAREIRRAEVGDEAAAEEEQRGNKPDEEYAMEAIVRRNTREKQRERQEARKRREEEVERLRSLEEKKKAELNKLRRADEKRRENQAKEEQRSKAREAHRALLRQKEKEEELRREERRKEETIRSQARDRSTDRTRVNHGFEGAPQSWEPRRDESRTPHTEKPATTPPASPVDEKALEVAALELLLREGRELAAKSGSRVEQERCESLELPSLRKSSSVKPPKLAEPSPTERPYADRSRSPQKAVVVPKGPKLSYSQTRRPAASPPPGPSPRSRSPSHAQNWRDKTDEHYNKASESDLKSTWTKPTNTRYGAENDSRMGSRNRSKSRAHRDEDWRSYHESSQTSSRHQGHKEDDYYSHDRGRQEDRARYRDHDEEKYRSSHDHDYERQKDYSLRKYEGDKDKYRSSRNRSRERDPDRDKNRERRYERSGRSRSGERSNHHRAIGYIETRGPRMGDRPRAKSPVEIDRYVPSTSSRAKELEPRTHRERLKVEFDGAEDQVQSKELEKYGEKDRSVEKEKERGTDRERGRDKEKDKDRYAERDRYGERGRDKYGEKERYAEREREPKQWVDIDRYVPGGGDRARERDRDRERDRERERGRERSR